MYLIFDILIFVVEFNFEKLIENSPIIHV